MSEENVEIVRRIYEAFNQRDLAPAFELVAPDFEWIPPDRSFEATVRGREEVQRFLEDQIETLDMQVRPEEFFEQGDRVVAFVRVQAQGQASGAGVEILAANVWTFRNGIPVRGETYAERAAALEAAGLSE